MNTFTKENFYKTIVAFEIATGETVSYDDKVATRYDLIHRQSGKSGKWFSSSNVVIHTFNHNPSEEEIKTAGGRLRAIWIEERQEAVIELSDNQLSKINNWSKEQTATSKNKNRKSQTKQGNRQREQNVAIFENPENLDEKGKCIDVRKIKAGDKYPKNISEFDALFHTDYESKGFEFSFIGKATSEKLHNKLNK